MAQLILYKDNRESAYHLVKKMTSVGTEQQHDICIADSSTHTLGGLLFTLLHQDEQYFLIPHEKSLRINGQLVAKQTPIKSCDRIEWPQGVACFLGKAESTLSGRVEQSLQSLKILHNISQTLQNQGTQLDSALHQLIDALVQLSGAEEGYLLTEFSAEGKWNMISKKNTEYPAEETNRKELLSHTILNQALQTRNVVHIENMIGHNLSRTESIINARLFSVACLPLIIEQKIFGAVFLSSRSPGRSIKKETLSELSLLATQAALLIASIAEKQKIQKEIHQLKTHKDTSLLFSENATPPSPMADVLKKINKLGPSTISVLILGETGTGKELVAREIHKKSLRKQGPFIAINCAAIPATLLESTLFGFERGAFTGAVKSQQGKFALAHKGTLFLDEIGDLPMELQAKLLRVLQEGVVEPIGSNKPISVDVRIVAATHHAIEKKIQSGQFRQDLYYRLAGSTVTIPPLRQRKQDIPLLSQTFVEQAIDKLTQEGNPLTQKTLSPAAMHTLTNYVWPGNVRELEHVIAKAVLFSDGDQIEAQDLELGQFTNSLAGSDLAHIAQTSTDDGTLDLDGVQTLDEAQRLFTEAFIQKQLEKHNGNRATTAKQLGISERTLYRLIAINPTSMKPQ